MIFTKRDLITEVHTVNHYIKHGLSPTDKAEMDREFYGQAAAEFWDDMYFLVDTMKQYSPEEMKRWVHDKGWESAKIANIPQAVKNISFEWIRSKASDRQIYHLMKDRDVKSDDDRIKLADEWLARFIYRDLA